MTGTPERIYLREVDDQDRTFVVSFAFDLGPLKASVAELGILSPPLLRRRPDGGLQIICGSKRLAVLHDLKQAVALAQVAPPDTPETWCLLASLYDNAFGRAYNTMEAAFMIHKLLRHFDQETIRRKYLPLLGLPPSLKHLHNIHSLVALEVPFQELVATNRLSPEAAAQVGHWPAPDRQAILPWLRDLRLSHSTQLEVLDYLTTLSRREGKPPAHWLAQPELAGLLADPALTAPEKSRRLLETLRQWSFPRISRAQEQFQHHLQALGLYRHPDMRLIPPPAFEDAAFRLELRFQDSSQLARQIQQVHTMMGQPEFEALWNL